MNKTKLLLLALAGLIMTGCVIREGGGGYYGGGYGGYEQRGYYSQRGDYGHHDDYGRPQYWR
jgi:hypothetical protein